MKTMGFDNDSSKSGRRQPRRGLSFQLPQLPQLRKHHQHDDSDDQDTTTTSSSSIAIGIDQPLSECENWFGSLDGQPEVVALDCALASTPSSASFCSEADSCANYRWDSPRSRRIVFSKPTSLTLFSSDDTCCPDGSEQENETARLLRDDDDSSSSSQSPQGSQKERRRKSGFLRFSYLPGVGKSVNNAKTSAATVDEDKGLLGEWHDFHSDRQLAFDVDSFEVDSNVLEELEETEPPLWVLQVDDDLETEPPLWVLQPDDLLELSTPPPPAPPLFSNTHRFSIAKEFVKNMGKRNKYDDLDCTLHFPWSVDLTKDDHEEDLTQPLTPFDIYGMHSSSPLYHGLEPQPSITKTQRSRRTSKSGRRKKKKKKNGGKVISRDYSFDSFPRASYFQSDLSTVEESPSEEDEGSCFQETSTLVSSSDSKGSSTETDPSSDSRDSENSNLLSDDTSDCDWELRGIEV
jgi:hypothetical protein